MDCMRSAHETGLPVMRPLFLDFPADQTGWEVDDEFLLGEDILVAPVITEGARERSVYLPAGAGGRDAWTGAACRGVNGSPRPPRWTRSPSTSERAARSGPSGVSLGDRDHPRRPLHGHPGAPTSSGAAQRPPPGPGAALGPVGFLVPAGAYVLFAFAVPVVYNLILSFELTSPATIASLFAPFAGFANYAATVGQSATQSVLLHTLLFTVGSLFFQFLIGFCLALLFQVKFPGGVLARSLHRALAAAVPDHRHHLPLPVPARGARSTSCSRRWA